MTAMCWHGKSDVRYDTVSDLRIGDPRDVIIEVANCAICGSELHFHDGHMPVLEPRQVATG